MTQRNEENLFCINPSESGFRLHYLEVLNWGTFDGKVQRIEPRGKNSLLTGDNGSGKSTLIDALLTLLVPYDRQRFYNQSSGSVNKKDRTVKSYMLGNYGVGMMGNTDIQTDLRLRDYKSKSILSACFKNLSENSVVTVFQIRYFKGTEISTIYGIAKTELHIKDDIYVPGKTITEWKNYIINKYNPGNRETVINITEGSPKAYASRLGEIFRLGPNAFKLFNQIVGVKVLHDLNEFIRYNMLEAKDMEDSYIKLKEYYNLVLETEKCLEYARTQNKLLEKPLQYYAKILTDSQKLESKNKEIRKMELCFRSEASRRIEKEKKSILSQKEGLSKEIEALREKQHSWEKDKEDLLQQQGQSDPNGRIQLLSNNKAHAEKNRDQKLEKKMKYDKEISSLGIQTVESFEMFQKYRSECHAKEYELTSELERLREQLSKKKSEDNTCDEKIKNIDADIELLRKNGNQISDRRVSDIRDEIRRYVGASKDEIPFIGELIKVKDSESDWNNSIEKVLHNLGLRIIVPEKYYRKINEYVNNNNLKGRIVYQLYKENPILYKPELWEKDLDLLYNKLDFKPGSTYTDGYWLQNIIHDKYNLRCVESISELESCESNAVTKEGLIKAEQGKHEKDDRPNRFKNFVLGWDNKNKIRDLANERNVISKEKEGIRNKIDEIDKKIKNSEGLKNQWHDIYTKYDSYDDIDYNSEVLKIEDYEKQIKDLKSSTPEYERITKQINVLKENIDKTTRKIEDYKHEINKDNNKLEELNIISSSSRLNIPKIITSEDTINYKHPLLTNYDVSAKEFIKEAEHILDKTKEEISELLKECNQSKSELKSKINEFKRPSKEIRVKFENWEDDVMNMPDYDEHNPAAIEEYKNLYDNNNKKIIPESEERFSKRMREEMSSHVSYFKQHIDENERNIRSSIESLNRPLKNIIYSTKPETYIKINIKRNGDKEIKDFEKSLNDANPNINQINTVPLNDIKSHFDNKIKPLIENLEKESWRQKVTDVRKWFNFTVEEYRIEDNSRYKIYEKMGQLSGGEKAQLTYSILGSAIAHQFKLSLSGKDSSFRFIAIDEAFKAQDDNKSRYLVSLCKQLHLQLLVVTPSNNMHIVENDIDYVHLIERIDERAVIRNMPIGQYKQIKLTREIDDKLIRNIKKSEQEL